MNDFIELMVGLMVCVLPPMVVVGGLLALVRFLQNDRNQKRIEHLEAVVGELRGQNLTLLHRMSGVEGRVAALEGPRMETVAEPAREPIVEEVVERVTEAEDAPVPAVVDEAAEDEAVEDEAVEDEAVGPVYGPVFSPEAVAAEGVVAGSDSGQGQGSEASGGRFAWEQWIGVRGAAALGASILVLAGIYFFEYSIEHGLITPAMRMVAGTLVGVGCVALSELKLRRSYSVLASWLSGAGIAILYVAFWAGQALYSLYPTWAAGVLMVATTGACVTLAVRRESMAIALLGLLGGFVTPLALSTGADRPIPLFGYLLLLDGAMLWLAWRRRWSWLAALCLLGTLVYQQAWLLTALDSPRLLLGLAIVGVFALLFAALPSMRESGEEREESLLWRLTRSAGVILPLLFTFPLAMRTDLGETFWVTAVQLVLLCLAAGYVGLRHRSRALPTAAAITSAVIVFGRAITHPPTEALAVWQPVALALGLAIVFYGLAELARRLDPERTHLAVAASGFTVLVLCFVALAAPFASAAGPWPWLLLWAGLWLVGARLGTLAGRPRLQIAVAALTAVGLGSTFAYVAGSDGQPDPGLYLGCLVGAAILCSLGGVLPFRSAEARRDADHAAALFAVLAMPLMALVRDVSAIPIWAFYACTVALGALALLATARRGSAAWLAVTALAVAGTQSLWVLRRHDAAFGPEELVVLAASVGALALFPALAPKRLRDQPWAWRTAALVGPAYLLPMRHVYLEAIGPQTIGLLPIGLAIISVGAATLVRLRGPEPLTARKTALVWLTASATGFVTLAIPLQLEQEWITIGWALEALALALLWRRLDHAGLKYMALALGVAVGVRLLANPYVLGYYERGDLRILNWLSYTYLVPALAFVGAWLALRGQEAARLRPWEQSVLPKPIPIVSHAAALAAIAVVFVWLNLTIVDWFATGPALTIPTDRLPARDLSLSIAWGVYAVAMLALGLWRKSTALRVASLLLVLVTCAKVFLYDLAQLADLYRVASLVGLAISLIVISLAYQRFVFRGARAEEPTR